MDSKLVFVCTAGKILLIMKVCFKFYLLHRLTLVFLSLLCAISFNAQNTLPTPEELLAKEQKIQMLANTPDVSSLFKAAGDPQNCDGAIAVCSQSYTQSTSYTGDGGTEEVYNGCLASGETNSVWYVFTCQTTGNFGFDLVTANDYDWALFDITTIGCEGVPSATPDRCNFSATNGSTGMDGTGVNPSEGAGGGPYSTELAVTAGETYVLVIDNWSADANGYTLNFTGGPGYSSITDVTPPLVATIAQSCVSGDKVIMTLSEEIQCASIESGGSDFSITGAGTPAVLSAVGINCTGNLTDQIEITFDNSPQIAAGTYTVTVNLGSDANTLLDKCDNSVTVATTANFEYLAPLTLTPDVASICSSGDPVVLTAAGLPAGETYTLTPGPASNTTGTFNVNPVATTTYTVSGTLGSCSVTQSTTITLVDNVVVSIDPIDPTVCSAPTTLTASATVNGTACPTCVFDWSNDGTGDYDDAAGQSMAVGTWTASAETVEGCASDNTASSTVSLASAGGGASCNIIYVSSAGGGDGLTKGAPTDIKTALINAQCTNTIIKCAVGTYTYDEFLDVKSFATIEGGYNAAFTTKTSDLTSGNATTFVRSATTADGGAGTVFSMFKINGGEDDWRIQNVRIEMPTTHTAASLNSNRAINIGTGCTGYKIVGCMIDAGTGADGTPAGPRNTIMWSSGIEAADSPVTYELSDGVSLATSTNGPRTGTNHSRIEGLAGGGKGKYDGVIISEQINFVGGDDYLIDCYHTVGVCGGFAKITKSATATYAALSAAAGADEIVANTVNNTAAPTWTLYSGTWTPAGAENYYVGIVLDQPGTTGGCGGAYAYVDDIVITDVTVVAGTAGGVAYGVYAPDAIDEVNDIVDCEIVATAGVSTTEQLVSENGVDAGYTSVAVSGYAVITVENISCLNSDMDFTTADGTPVWPAGALGTNATIADPADAGTVDNNQYSATLGRRDITFEGDETNFTGCQATTWSSGAVPSPKDVIGNVDCDGAVDIVVPAQSCTWDPADIVVGIDITATENSCYSIRLFTPYGDELSLIWGNSDPTWDNPQCTFTDAGTYATFTSGGATNTSSFQPQGDVNAWCGTTPDITTFGAINGGAAMNMGGTWSLYVDRGCGLTKTFNSWTISVPNDATYVAPQADQSNTYEDFVNIIMDKPAAGSILGTSGVCPGTYNFASSEAGTPGYTYSWTVTDPGAETSVVTSATASSTDISFTNSTAAAVVYTVRQDITSECCGALTQVTYNVTVNPIPDDPAVTNAAITECYGGSIGMSVSGPDASYTYDWYDAVTGGTLLGSGTSYTETSVPYGGDSYFVQATSSNGCVSDSRTEVTLTDRDTDPAVNNGTYCAAGDVEVSVTAVAGTIYTWYDDAVGTTVLQSGVGLTYDVNVPGPAPQTVSVYVTATEPGCTESDTIKVDADITASAATTTWTGAVSTDWFVSGNWSDCVPNCDVDALFIGGAVTNECNIKFSEGTAAGTDGIARAKDISIHADRTITWGEAKSTLNVCGDFTHNGTITMTSLGKVAFVSTDATQSYTKGAGAAGDFYTLEINNTHSTPTVTIAGTNNMEIATDGQLSLTAGLLVTGSNMIIVNNTSTGAVTGQSTASYVNGTIRRYTAATGNYLFPVGNSTAYELMDMGITGGNTANYFDVDFTTPANATGTGLTLTEGIINYDAVLNTGGVNATTGSANGGVWTVTPDGGTANYDMTIYGRNFDNDLATRTIVKRATAGPGAWTLAGTFGSESNVANLVTVNRTGYSGFSQFAIVRSGDDLPIELLSFTGKLNGKVVDLFWATESEINNDYFTIERSQDGVNFEVVGTVDGAGNSSSVIHYTLTDKEPLNGLSYYRLKQTDFNGEFAYSHLVPIKVVESNEHFEIYPNPVVDDLSVIFSKISAVSKELKIFDARSKLVYSETIEPQTKTVDIDLSKFERGVYFITVDDNQDLDNTEKIKFVKQ